MRLWHTALSQQVHMVQNDYDTLFTGAQRGEVTSPRSHSQQMMELGFEPKSVWTHNAMLLPIHYPSLPG